LATTAGSLLVQATALFVALAGASVAVRSLGEPNTRSSVAGKVRPVTATSMDPSPPPLHEAKDMAKAAKADARSLGTRFLIGLPEKKD
jgi:hypothetical protein